jgi:hypothetical protein
VCIITSGMPVWKFEDKEEHEVGRVETSRDDPSEAGGVSPLVPRMRRVSKILKVVPSWALPVSWPRETKNAQG